MQQWYVQLAVPLATVEESTCWKRRSPTAGERGPTVSSAGLLVTDALLSITVTL
jgi:hypothetical protein